MRSLAAPFLMPPILILLFLGLRLVAAERRAPPPEFSKNSFPGTFFDSVGEAIRGDRGRIGEMSSGSEPLPQVSPDPQVATAPAPSSSSSVFSRLISPTSLEDEIKRLRLEFDAAITTPAAFRSGDFQKARFHLTTLAALFAVIAEYDGDVRWKRDAAAARDLFARTAANCKSGSSQVYNEAKLRKADLEDLVGGGGISGRQADPETDWSLIADRSPLMNYAELLLDGPLKENSRNLDVIKSGGDAIRRAAELLSVVGEILRKEGMADADDDDYANLCQEMIDACSMVLLALEQGRPSDVGPAVGTVSQACSKCHENYR